MNKNLSQAYSQLTKQDYNKIVILNLSNDQSVASTTFLRVFICRRKRRYSHQYIYAKLN